MIPVPAGVRVWLASGVTDMRNYAQRMIMQSRWQVLFRHQRLNIVSLRIFSGAANVGEH
jgi:hypothetical protein